MNCREALELLDDTLDGTLQARASWRLKLHLWICGHCRRYLASYKTTLRLERAAFDETGEAEPKVPDELVAEITNALRKAAQPAAQNGDAAGSRQSGS